jgi:UDP-glucose 4-epimerase
MKAIVTGGAGFIGSHVAGVLVEQGHQVLVIDDLSGGFRENVPIGAGFLRASVLSDLRPVFENFRPDTVYHLAAYAAEGLSHHIPLFNYQNNLEGTANVLGAAYHAGVKHFVFTSSIAVYGHPHSPEPFRESDAPTPADPYGIAKYACENHLRAFRDYFGRPDFTIFRPHNVYGERQNISDPFRNVVGIFMNRALRGESLPVFGDGSQTRSFSYIRSVADCIASAPLVEGAKNEVFNVGGDVATSVAELARTVASVLGIPAKLQCLEERKEVKHAHASHEKLQRVFGAEARDISLREGLEQMAAYVKFHPVPPATPCPSPVEIADGLPPSWRQSVTALRDAVAEDAAEAVNEAAPVPQLA